MNLQKVVDAFSEKERSTKPSDQGEPGAVLFFNSSFKKILETLQRRQENFQEILSNQKGRMQSLINQFSELQEMVSQLTGQVDSLSSEVTSLRSEVKKLRSNTVNQEVLNELKEEATRYREDWVRKRDIGTIKKQIQLYDDFEYIGEPDQVSALRKAMLGILNQKNVEKIENISEKFDPDYMKAVEVEETNKADQDMEVKKNVKDGFKFSDGEIIRPVEVQIARFAEEVQDE